MTGRPAPTVAEVSEALLAVHRDTDGATKERITFRSWTPHSERKQRQRLFVESTLDGTPRYVAKVPLDEQDGMVQREWQILSGLRGLDTLRPRAVRRLGRGFVMTYVAAVDFPDRMAAASPAAWPELLGDALELAATVHRSAPASTSVTAIDVAAAYLPDLDRLPGSALAGLDGAAVGPAHGDLGPWNLRVDGRGRISLIDWEDYQPTGLPALDVLNVVHTAALIAHPDYRERGFGWLFEQVFHGTGAFRLAVDQALDRYARLTGADSAAIMRLTRSSAIG